GNPNPIPPGDLSIAESLSHKPLQISPSPAPNFLPGTWAASPKDSGGEAWFS
ncbi:hypothetical protein P7K49_029139, partial [Saguinus oedipus]